MADDTTTLPPPQDTTPKIGRPILQPPAQNYRPSGSLRDALGLGDIDQRLGFDRAKIDAMEQPQAPTLSAPPPKEPTTDPYLAWGQPAMWLAVFGGLLTKRPLVAALGAAGQVVQATHSMDAQQAQRAYDVWKVESENALKLAKFEQDAYKVAISKYAADARAGEAEVRTLNAAFKNSALTQVYETQGMPGVARYLGKHHRDTQALSDHTEAASKTLGDQVDMTTMLTSDDIHDQAKGVLAFRDNVIKAGTGKKETPDQREKNVVLGVQLTALANDLDHGDPERVAAAQDKLKGILGFGLKAMSTVPKAGQGTAKPLTDEAARQQAMFYLRTGQISAGFGGQAVRTQIMEEADKIAKEQGQSVDDILSNRAALKADTASLAAVTKQKNAAEGYERGAIKSLDMAASLVPPTPEPLNMQILTRWARTGATEFGDTTVPPFTAALITGLDQYAKVLSGATGAQGSTDSARNLALSLIPAGSTSAQIPPILAVLKKDMAFKVSGYDAQLAELRGGIEHPKGTAGAAIPLPMVMQDGKEMPDASKLKGGQIYTLPDGRKAVFDDQRQGFTPVQ